MRKLVASAALCFAALVGAQTPAPRPVALPPILSPQVQPDRTVTFRIRAPKASEVTIAGDFWLQENRADKLTKGEDGVWSITTEPLHPDYYSYFFTVDGVRLPDPANGLIKPGIGSTQSAFWVPGPEAELLQSANVPHGEVRIVNYLAPSLAKQRRMRIYFPPGYEAAKAKYPVVYLFHGGGDDDWGWVDVGRVNFILDNLIAQGKAKPMIVVMPSLWAIDPPVRSDRAAENETLFQKSLVADIIPYVDSHYRTLANPASRAIAGLGAGRNMMPDVLWPSLSSIGYVGSVSGGADADLFAALTKKYPGTIDNPANIKRMKFFFANGISDNSYAMTKYTAEALKKLGYNVTLFESQNSHGWPEFRLNFIQFAQIAFR